MVRMKKMIGKHKKYQFLKKNIYFSGSCLYNVGVVLCPKKGKEG